MSEYKTIRVSKKEYDLLTEARNKLIHSGTHSFNEDFRQKKEVKDVDSLALGALVGLGALAILFLMSGNGG